MRLSVIVPARNEADVLRPCLESLLAQSESGFALGTDWELLLVDDGSTDQTRSIALSLPGVTVLDPEELKPGWTGKANAVWTAARHARGDWLLFTDADTVHEAGDLQRALHEAEHAQVVMLSYSPRQVVTGFWQRALMPLVFSELSFAYPPAKVSDPSSRVAAANGQFLLVQRAAYFQVGATRRRPARCSKMWIWHLSSSAASFPSASVTRPMRSAPGCTAVSAPWSRVGPRIWPGYLACL